MSQPTLGGLMLRLRLALLRTNPLMLAAGALCLAVAGSALWVDRAVFTLAAERAAWQAQAAHAAAASAQRRDPGKGSGEGQAGAPAAVHVASAPDNLAVFYATLGQRREAEQQVKTLFGLAAQDGLTLSQGEYKSAYERNARLYTYQVTLPVKGSYEAIWQLAMGALRAIPFAALDDIGFRRDAIGDPQVEARLRLTFYLADTPAGGTIAGASGAAAAVANEPADAVRPGAGATLAARGAGGVR